MDQMKITTLFLTLIIISLFHLSTSQNLVQDICKQAAGLPPTTFNDCVAALAANPKSASANLKGLAQITLKSGISNATEARKHTDALVATVAPALKGPLGNCSSWFSAAANSFGSALEELDEDLESANYDAKIAGDDARNCQAALAAGKVSEASVGVRIVYVQLYSNIADVITDRLDN